MEVKKEKQNQSGQIAMDDNAYRILLKVREELKANGIRKSTFSDAVRELQKRANVQLNMED